MPELFRGDRFQRKRRLRVGIVGAISTALTVSMLTGPAWAGPEKFKLREAQKTKSVKGHDLKPGKKNTPAGATPWKPSPVTWPSPGTAEVTLPAASPLAKTNLFTQSQAGSLPVRVTPAAQPSPSAGAKFLAPAKDLAAPGRVKVTVAGREKAQQAGIDGLLLSVQRSDGSTSAGAAQVEVDYSKIKGAYGANWASSLQLIELPACALTTPSKPECLKGTPLRTRNNPATGTLSAAVDLPAATSASAKAMSSPASASWLAAPSGGMTVLAAAPGAAGTDGSFKATSLAPSGSWSAGGNSGGFGWSIPFAVPPVPGGLSPKVGLSYSSSSVDGRTGVTNNQTSWVGEGWEYSPGFIERKYVPCENDKQGGNNTEKVGDLCWKSENATMSLNGSSSELLWDAAKKVWKLSNDDGSRVERIYDSPGNNSGDSDSEYWRVTTTDGSQYWFGKNRLPGWTTGKEETKSVNTVPVYGNHAGEQGHATDFASSSEMQGWRWNLDYVVDPHGNAMALYYGRYTAYYAKNGKIDAPVAYFRDSVLKKISYGLRAGEVYTPALAPAQVNFNVSNRCTAGTCTLDEAHASDWPDVPVHLDCNEGVRCLQGSPTFWSSKRLTSIDTVALVGDAHQPVDTWTLAQSYPATGDTSTPALWLDSVQHTGKAGALADITLPKTVFTGTPMANRVDKAEGRPPIYKRRITQITNETGANTFVTYSPAECSATNLPAADDTNTKRCYPSWWTRDGGTEEVKDYFHKYLVTKVEDTDTTAGTGSPSTSTVYEYPSTPNWRRDQSEFTLDKHRTWNDFRGYRTVRTLTGTTNRIKSETDYYAGMAGDKLANGTDRTVERINDVTDRSDFGGKVAASRTYESEAGPVVEKRTQTPWESETTASQPVVGITDPEKATTPGPALAPKLARLSGTTTTVTSKLMANGTWQDATTTRTYDPTYGLILTEGDDGAKTTEPRCAITQYVTPDTANWLIAYPSQTSTTTSLPCTNTVSAPAVTSASRTSYDRQAVGTGPKAGQANVTRIEQASNLDAGNQLIWESTDQATHDAYGRVLTTTGQDGQTTSTVYTPATGPQPTSVVVTNPKGHTATSTYDGLRGLSLTNTEANSRTVSSEYDALGRLTKGWAAGRPTSQQPNVTFTYNVSATAPSTVTTKNLFEGGLWGTSVTIYDSLLRQRQTQSDAIGVVGRTITDTFYDDHGRNYRSNAPYYDAQGVSTTMLVVPDNQIPSATENDYDGRGRVTDSITLSLSQEKWRTSNTYGPDWQASVPPQGAPATLTVSDVRGRAVERRQYKDRNPVIQAAGTQFEKHSYAYDRAGLLSKITDTGGRNSWTYTYDLRGRQTVVTDPDKGKSTTAYGTDGRAQTVTDDRGVTLATTYDELGRATSLRKGTVTGTKLAEWTYDTATGGKGLPATSTRYDGTAAYTSAVTGYSGAGTPTGTQVTIPSVIGEEKLAGTYTIAATATPINNLPSKTTYSTTNTNATTALPAETLTNSYGGQDQLGIVSGSLKQAYLRGAGYTEFGELAQAQLGNLGSMVIQSLFRDPVTRRVVRADVDREASGPGNLSITKYTYDPAGNITRILDDQNDFTVKDDQCFAYDWAARLSEAWTSGDDCTTKPVNGTGSPNLGTVDPYWTSWTFTDTGQRATETQHKAGPITADTTRTHTYPTTAGAAQAHALRSVTATGGATGTDTFAYDATGNMTSRTPAVPGSPQTMTWNDEGKIASSTIAGATTSFLYDTAGTRILKREAAATTLYLPGGQELLLDKTTGTVSGTRYYNVPGGTAMRTSTDGRVRFLMADHHGTNTISVAADTLTFNRRKQLPYGAERGTPPAAWPSQKGFVGGDIDKTTGLTHIGARDYDTKLGQFISVDPILAPDSPQSLNGYGYANNNPVTTADPTGMCAEVDCPTRPSPIHENTTPGHTPQKPKVSQNGGAPPPPKNPRPSKKSNRSGHCPAGVRACLPPGSDAEGAGNSAAGFLSAIIHSVESTSELTVAPECLNSAMPECNEGDEFDQWATGQGFDLDGNAADLGRLSAFIAPFLFKKFKPSSTNCKCFLAGTGILMADGAIKNIEDIKIGDEVKATDPETGRTESREVTRLIVTEDDKYFNTLSIATEDGTKELTATHEHPFWSPSAHTWVEAGNLTPGATLLSDDGSTVTVTANKPHTRNATTYNLTVDGLHTYYVLAGATPVLVHNSNGLCGTAALDNGDWQHIVDRHRPGGALVDDAAGIFTGKAKHVRQRIADTINRGTPRANTPDPVTGEARPGQIYEWDFGSPVGRAGSANGGGELTGVRVIVNDGKVVTAFPY
ncbi:polymorphic toxin-type HINT domain-containing protein [Streptomyces sp. Mg1]|uniref:polymorphic toxin-type HINT domain-containing protein n=1 Tax=Streptomyces sp. Mg1 TaxID=465541 RepID=UPI0011DF7265|nr:polymorphic toxin-type HINT domain-containing protein [Streptomyces sp. Mg1]